MAASLAAGQPLVLAKKAEFSGRMFSGFSSIPPLSLPCRPEGRFQGITERRSRRGRSFTFAAATKDTSTTAFSKIETLKKQLEDSLNRTETNLSEESLGIIAELEALNPTPDPVKRVDLWSGPFQMLNSTMKNVLYRGAKITLGRATFNVFKPNDLGIIMEEVYNDVNIHGSGSYNFLIPFTISHDGFPPLKGVLFNEAKITPSAENPNTRADVEFLASTLMPRDASVDLSEWLKAFGELNVMDNKGVAKIELPKTKGWFDFIYLDENLRITKGNFGTLNVVKRLDSPAIPIQV